MVVTTMRIIPQKFIQTMRIISQKFIQEMVTYFMLACRQIQSHAHHPVFAWRANPMLSLPFIDHYSTREQQSLCGCPGGRREREQGRRC